MKRDYLLLALILIFILSSCSMLDERYEPTILAWVEETIIAFTEVPTNTPYSTYTPYPTLTDLPTYTPEIIIVTATYTHTPEFSPTITDTPTITPSPTNTHTPSPTLDKTRMDKSSGFYLIGNEISPGLWRSLGTSDSCYWSITTKTGSILNNHFGMAGGTMYIPSHGFQVELDHDCGKWTFLGE